MAFYQWSCEVAAEVTFQPSSGRKSPPAIYTHYRNSHLRFKGLEGVDCFANVRLLNREQLQPGETGSTQMNVLIPADSLDDVNDVLHEGSEFSLFEAGSRIAMGRITALLTGAKSLD